MTENEIHAHVDSYSTDCDGAISRSYLMTLTDADRAKREAAAGVNDFTDIEFTDRVVAHMVNAYSLMYEGKLTVRKHEDGDVMLNWSEATEEGGRAVDVRICRDACDLGEDSSYRDHRAEAMGY